MTAFVYIVDPHPITQLGYVALLNDQDDVKVSGRTSELAKARNEIADHAENGALDLVIVDVGIEGVKGLTLLEDIQETYEEVRTLVVSRYAETLYGERVLQAGARGFVTKDATESDLLEAIETVLEGDFYISRELEHRVIRKYTGRTDGGPPLHMLSDRELDIFKRIGMGASTRDIAETLDISIKTVQTHRTHIKEKLELDTVESLMRRAVLWTLENL